MPEMTDKQRKTHGLGPDRAGVITLPNAKQLRERERREAAEARQHEPAAETLLTLLWLDDITPVLDAKDFVQGMLVEGSAAVVYGDSNAGKTFLTTDLALHVAAGKVWNGRRVDQGGVIYCALEGGNGFRNRVSAWCQRHAGDSAGLPFAAIPVSLNLLDPDADTPRLIETVKAAAAQMGRPVKLVVIDTLSRAMAGGNENAPDDMGALVANMDAIRAATGACVLFVHHSGKDAAKGARGHSLLRAAVDTEVEVKVDEATGARTATVVKQRELAKGAVSGFRLDVVVLGQNQHGEDVTTCTVVEQDAEPTLTTAGKRSKGDVETESLLRHLHDSIASGQGQDRVPIPGMQPVPTLSRATFQAVLIQWGWLKVSSEVSSAGHPAETIPKVEHTRLWKTLTRLKLQGKIGFNRNDVWLAKPAATP